MKAPSAAVQSVFDFAMREINALENRIVKTEDDADAMLWEQAGQVVAQLEAGLTQRQLAAQWINIRTGEPYSVAHVNYTAKVYRVKFTEQPRPRFRDAYNTMANAASPAHVSHNSGEQEWYTPSEYIDAARLVMGGIDLDPATTPAANQIIQAPQIFTKAENGLTARWDGRVWMNPPYDYPLIEQFCAKLAAEVEAFHVSQACVLVNNATETAWFGALASVATAICFPDSRIHFWSPTAETASPLQGQAILYIGDRAEAFCQAFGGLGWLVRIVSRPR